MGQRVAWAAGLAISLGACTSGTMVSIGTSGNTTSGASSSTSSGGSTGASSSGGSTGGAASTTGSAGSTTGAGCVAFGLPRLSACAVDADCQCPARCVLDRGLSPFLLSPTQKECELPCQATADCQSPAEHCLDGSCGPNLCNEMLIDGGIVGAAAWQLCDAAGVADGTCINIQTAVLQGNQNTLLSSYVCWQGGGSDGGCELDAGRDQPDELCAAGLFCERPGFISGLDVAACREGCVPGDDGGCPTGQLCGADSVCHDLGAGGCLTGFVDETFPCAADSDCGCPRHCRLDVGMGANRCEDSCATSADCSLDVEHCVGGLCTTNFCAADVLGNPAPGAYAQPCDAIDGGDGNCLAVGFEGGGFPGEFEFGVCLRGGTASDSCAVPLLNQVGGIASFALVTFGTPLGLPLSGAELCPVGDICTFLDAGVAACVGLCDPLLDGGGSCASGVCVEQGGDPVVDMGACLACMPSGGNCSLPSDCCSGSCPNSICE